MASMARQSTVSAQVKQWWSAVKRIAGMNPASSSESLLSNLQVRDSFDRLSDAELANAINAMFLEPTKH